MQTESTPEGIFATLEGSQPGPTLVVLAGVHGNETAGIRAFEEVVPTLTLQKGKVIFILGNPRAIEQNVRFTEANLNRMFKREFSDAERASYEYARAQELKPYLAAADAVLDMHGSFTPDATPFVIAEPQFNDVAAWLPASLVVSGFDEHEPGGTDMYVNECGGKGLGFECGYLGDPLTKEIAKVALINFLASFGVIAPEKATHIPETQRYLSITLLHKTNQNFVRTKEYADFALVKNGECIGMDGEVPICAPSDGFVVFVRNREGAGEEAFLFGV